MDNKQILISKLKASISGEDGISKEAGRLGQFFSRAGKKTSQFDDAMRSVKSGGEGLAGLVAAAGGVTAAAKLLKDFKRANDLRKMSPAKRMLTEAFGKDTIGRRALMFGAGAAGLAGGIKGVESLSEGIANPIRKRSAFNSMMEDNPSLKREDQKDVKRVFNTLYRFNPKMAADPLVAGSFMKRTLQFKDEGIQPVDVKTLTEIGRNMSPGRSDSLLSSAFLGGARDLATFA